MKRNELWLDWENHLDQKSDPENWKNSKNQAQIEKNYKNLMICFSSTRNITPNKVPLQLEQCKSFNFFVIFPKKKMIYTNKTLINWYLKIP